MRASTRLTVDGVFRPLVFGRMVCQSLHSFIRHPILTTHPISRPTTVLTNYRERFQPVSQHAFKQTRSHNTFTMCSGEGGRGKPSPATKKYRVIMHMLNAYVVVSIYLHTCGGRFGFANRHQGRGIDVGAARSGGTLPTLRAGFRRLQVSAGGGRVTLPGTRHLIGLAVIFEAIAHVA